MSELTATNCGPPYLFSSLVLHFLYMFYNFLIFLLPATIYI